VISLYPWMKVKHMVAYTAAFYRTWNADLAGQLVHRWEIPIDDRIGVLSVGQLQKLSIVLALAHEPELLIFDEPAASLDPVARREFLSEVLAQYYSGPEAGTRVPAVSDAQDARATQFVPREIHVPIEFNDRELLEKALSERKGRRVHILAPQRGEKRDLVNHALNNAREARWRERLAPYYSELAIDPSLLRASSGLGASPWRTFLQVTLPLSMPGVAAGGLLVFVLALGFYITPAMVGGPREITLSMLIAQQVDQLNWSYAATLSAVLLVTALAIIGICYRLPGVGKAFRMNMR